MECTQNGLYNLKEYDSYKIKILNDLVHITLLHAINICDGLYPPVQELAGCMWTVVWINYVFPSLAVIVNSSK